MSWIVSVNSLDTAFQFLALPIVISLFKFKTNIKLYFAHELYDTQFSLFCFIIDELW